MARLSLLAIAAAAVLLAAAPAAADDHQMGMGAALSNFTLPTLPYGTDEFEPSIDNATMWLHWNRHTNAAMTGLNGALAKCPPPAGYPSTLAGLVLAAGDFESDECNTLMRRNAGAFWNHLLFYMHVLAPHGSQTYEEDASPELQAAIEDAFGSYDAFKANFSAAAAGVFGSGWAWLVAGDDGELSVVATPNQDNPLMALAEVDGLPILGLDVWEHAYYLKYQNRRPEYVTGIWDVLNWSGISDLYETALKGKAAYTALDVAKPAAVYGEADDSDSGMGSGMGSGSGSNGGNY